MYFKVNIILPSLVYGHIHFLRTVSNNFNVFFEFHISPLLCIYPPFYQTSQPIGSKKARREPYLYL